MIDIIIIIHIINFSYQRWIHPEHQAFGCGKPKNNICINTSWIKSRECLTKYRVE